MAHVAPIYPNFARGEVSPLMMGRIDIEQYPTCLDKCRNTYIRPYGCATRLTGTEFVSNTKNGGKVVLLKFVFSATDSYIIECGAGYFRFYQNGGAVLKSSANAWVTGTAYKKGDFVTENSKMYYCLVDHTAGTFATDLAADKWIEQNIYEVPNDYYEDQLKSIQYVQLDDIIKLTCLPHGADNSTAKPKELIRKASDDWTFRDVVFKETPYLDQNTTDITMTPSGTTGNITITASSAYFDSKMVGANMWIGTKVTDSATNKDVQGYVKITGFTDSTHVSATVQSTLSGASATKIWGEGAFSDYRGYPAVVALYDGRLYYARTPYQPRNIYGSKPYTYEAFTPAVNNEDDGGINVALATNANGDGSDIRWMIGASFLLCGTYGGEFVIRGSGDGAITAKDISARQRTNWGGERVQPIVAGTFIHFLQRNGNKLRQFQYDFYYDSYKAVDVSIFSEHLLESPIKAMALQKNPDSIIYLLREDGKVVMLTLEQDQSVQAWSLLEELGAEVESIQTIPSYDGNFDEVYMVMLRSTLATSLSVVSSNPSVTVTDSYTGTKSTEGTETVVLTYDGTHEVWTNPDSEGLHTKLSVISSNASLSPTTTYSSTKSEEGTITETLKCVADSTDFDWSDEVLFYTLPREGYDAWAASCYGNGKIIMLSEYGYTSTSTDSVTWTTLKRISGASFYMVDVAYGDNKFVALSQQGETSTSTDGITWSALTETLGSAGSNDFWQGLTFDGSKFIALSYAGKVATSTDGTNWTTPEQKLPHQISSPNYYNWQWRSLTYGNNKIIAVADAGVDNSTWISVSIDGSTWADVVKIDTTDVPIDIIFTGNVFVIIGNNHLLVSEDDINWRQELTPPRVNANYWAVLGYIDLKLIVFSSNGYMSNTALGYWQSQTTGNKVDLTSANYAITFAGMPVANDTLTCTWNTISGYVNPSSLDLTVTGTPSNNDTITLTYTSTFSTPVRYIERMLNPITPENPNEWWYVRSGLKYSGYQLTDGITLTLSANSGEVTATASSSIFTSSMVGNRIRFIDDDYNILGEGEIKTYTSGTVVTLNITTYFQSLTIEGGKWGISTDTVSGLEHLNGREVQIYADCIEQENKTVIDGSIDIDDAFIAVIGLPYQSYITTMPMEAGSQNGTAVGKRKRISEMAIRVWNSLGVKVGRDFEHLYDTIYEQKEPYTGVIPNIKYNQGWVWDANITVEQSHPYPMNILSIAPIVTEVDK